RGKDRCRHFVLDQGLDGYYMILGEKSAHRKLEELLEYYMVTPVIPYQEFLTIPCSR
ncbi:SH22A protein, partial [Bucco capensis]|nr:SH22A protein [Bucco capensis]